MNTGPGNARNIGAHFAKGNIVVFLDADMEFPPNFIANLVKPILSGSSKSSCPGDEIIANVDNPWVRVRYCQVGITSSPPALMILCIIAIAVTNSSTLFNVFEFTLL